MNSSIGRILLLLAIVGIGVAVAIPNMLTERVGWNDDSAIASLRWIADAQHEFAATHGRFTTFEVLSCADEVEAGRQPQCRPLLSGAWRNPVKGLVSRSGYFFRIDLLADSFRVFAWPVNHGNSGDYSFVVGPDRVIRMTNNPAYTDRNGPTCVHDDEWTADLSGRHD